MSLKKYWWEEGSEIDRLRKENNLLKLKTEEFKRMARRKHRHNGRGLPSKKVLDVEEMMFDNLISRHQDKYPEIYANTPSNAASRSRRSRKAHHYTSKYNTSEYNFSRTSNSRTNHNNVEISNLFDDKMQNCINSLKRKLNAEISKNKKFSKIIKELSSKLDAFEKGKDRNDSKINFLILENLRLRDQDAAFRMKQKFKGKKTKGSRQCSKANLNGGDHGHGSTKKLRKSESMVRENEILKFENEKNRMKLANLEYKASRLSKENAKLKSQVTQLQDKEENCQSKISELTQNLDKQKEEIRQHLRKTHSLAMFRDIVMQQNMKGSKRIDVLNRSLK